MENYKIRVATLKDSSAIGKLSVQLGYASSAGGTEHRLKLLLQSDDHAVFVAYSREDSVVGWVHVFRTLRVESNTFSELGGLVVAESHRGRGIGRMLVSRAEEWSLEQGISLLRARTRSDRREAHAFYERTGFSLIKEQYVCDKHLQPIA